MIRVAIVDDEPLAIQRLRVLCKQTEAVEVVGHALSISEAISSLSRWRPHVVLLDIHMPVASGLDFLSSARASGAQVPGVIFVTAYDQYAVQAFDVGAVDYLLKPVSLDRLEKSLSRARRNNIMHDVGQVNDRHFWWPSSNAHLQRVAERDIRKLTSERDYVIIQTCKNSLILRSTLSSLLKEIDSSTFLQINRSTAIRSALAKTICRDGSRTAIVMDDGEIISVGKTFAARVKERLLSLKA